MSGETEDIWHLFGMRLKAYISRRISSPEDAEDLLQEAFLRFHRASPPAGNLAAWVFAVVRNLITDYYRARRDTADLVEEFPNPVRFEVSEAEQEVAGWLRDLAADLPPKYAEAVVRADFEGMTMKDLAGSLNLSVSGAKSRVQRGRVLMMKALTRCCDIYFDHQGRVEGWRKRNQCPCD